jgi:hypothetical protein
MAVVNAGGPMKHLTIRNIPPEVANRLQEERERSKTSLNQTVIRLLGRSLHVDPVEEKRNGLSRLAGTWTEEEHRLFEANLAVTEQVDEELWK